MAVRKHNPVLTVLKFLLAAIIAVALVKIAFFPADGSLTADGGEVPGANFTDPTLTPTRGDITASVTLDASVTQDAAQEAKTSLAGAIQTLSVADGADVAAGAVLVRVRQETPVPPREVTDPDGSVRIVEQRPRVATADITAPVAGKVTLRVLKDQEVAVGDVIASVQPATNSVVATLTPEQRYRLIAAPTEATVTLRGGPGPFTCTGVTVGTTTDSGGQGDGGTGGTGGTTASVRCAVPAEVTVFPGLSGQMALQTGAATGVLLLPTTAVQGLYATGKVWVVDEAGTQTPTDVTLGLTDGTQIEITGGLEEGTTVLQYAPVAREATDGASDAPMVMGG